MSLLAGYDMVIEISRAKLVEYIRVSTVAGQSLAAPTEFVVGNATNGADLILLQDVDLSFSPADGSATIIIPFEDSTFTINGVVLGPVKGTLSIKGTFELEDAPGADPNALPHWRWITFRPQPQGVSHSWDKSVGYCAQALATLHDQSMFDQELDRAIYLVMLQQNLQAGPPWLIDDSQNGTIGGQFCQLYAFPISAEVLGLFGILLTQHLNQGDHVQKTGSVLAQGESLAVSLSPDAFHDLVFCPQLAGLGSVQGAPLPPDCGSADGLLISGGNYITDISITFDDAGVIHLKGSVTNRKPDEPYCFRVDGPFWTDLSLPITNGVIQPVLNPNPPNTDLSLDVSWYCAVLWLVPSLLGGIISLLIVTLIGAIAGAITQIVVSEHQVSKLGQLPPTQIGFAKTSWDSSAITSEGLTLQGRLPSPPIPPRADQGVTLNVSSGALNVSLGKPFAGVYHIDGGCMKGDWNYIEKPLAVEALCVAQAHLFNARTTQFKWTIDQNPPQILTGNSGTVVIHPNVWLLVPDGNQQQLGQKSVPVQYAISQDGSTLTLTDNSGYCYSLFISVDCSDKSGASAAAWEYASLIGDIIVFDAAYQQQKRHCWENMANLINSLRTLPQGVPPGGDPGDLTEEQIIQILREAISENIPGVGAALSEATERFGASMRDAVYSSLLGNFGGTQPGIASEALNTGGREQMSPAVTGGQQAKLRNDFNFNCVHCRTVS